MPSVVGFGAAPQAPPSTQAPDLSRLSALLSLFPQMQEDPESLVAASYAPLETEGIAQGLGQAMGEVKLIGRINNVRRQSGDVQREWWAQLSDASRELYTQAGYTPPSDDKGGGGFLSRVGQVMDFLVPETTEDVIGTGLHVMDVVGDQVAHAYRAGKAIEWEHGNLAVVLGGPGLWADAWGETANGERYFHPQARRAADEFLQGNPHLIEIARQMAGGTTPEELLSNRFTPGTPEYQAAGLKLYEVVQTPGFQEALNVLSEGKVSFGRNTANVLGLEPGSVAYTTISGSLDAAFVILLDPFLVAGKANKMIKAARFGIGALDDSARWAGEITRLYNSTQRTGLLATDTVGGQVQRRFQMIADAASQGRWDLMIEGMPQGVPLLAAFQNYGIENLTTKEGVLKFFQRQVGMRQLLMGNGGTMTKNSLQIPRLTRAGKAGTDFKIWLRREIDFTAEDDIRFHRNLTEEDIATWQVPQPPGVDMSVELHQRTSGEIAEIAQTIVDQAPLETSLGDAAAQVPKFQRVEGVPTKRQILQWQGTNPELFAEMEDSLGFLRRVYIGAPSIVRAPTRGTAKFIQGFTRQISTKRGAADLHGPQSIQMIANAVEVGLFGQAIPSQVRRAWLNHILFSPEADRMTAMLNYYDAIFDRIGIRKFEEGREYAAKFVDRARQLYSSDPALAAMALREDYSRKLPVGLLFDADFAASVGIPELRGLMAQSRRMGFLHTTLRGVNHEFVTTAMNRFWKPSVLLRLDFIPRAAGEELLSFVLRYPAGWAYAKLTTFAADEIGWDEVGRLSGTGLLPGMRPIVNTARRLRRHPVLKKWDAEGQTYHMMDTSMKLAASARNRAYGDATDYLVDQALIRSTEWVRRGLRQGFFRADDRMLRIAAERGINESSGPIITDLNELAKYRNGFLQLDPAAVTVVRKAIRDGRFVSAYAEAVSSHAAGYLDQGLFDARGSRIGIRKAHDSDDQAVVTEMHSDWDLAGPQDPLRHMRYFGALDHYLGRSNFGHDIAETALDYVSPEMLDDFGISIDDLWDYVQQSYDNVRVLLNWEEKQAYLEFLLKPSVERRAVLMDLITDEFGAIGDDLIDFISSDSLDTLAGLSARNRKWLAAILHRNYRPEGFFDNIDDIREAMMQKAQAMLTDPANAKQARTFPRWNHTSTGLEVSRPPADGHSRLYVPLIPREAWDIWMGLDPVQRGHVLQMSGLDEDTLNMLVDGLKAVEPGYDKIMLNNWDRINMPVGQMGFADAYQAKIVSESLTQALFARAGSTTRVHSASVAFVDIATGRLLKTRVFGSKNLARLSQHNRTGAIMYQLPLPDMGVMEELGSTTPVREIIKFPEDATVFSQAEEFKAQVGKIKAQAERDGRNDIVLRISTASLAHETLLEKIKQLQMNISAKSQLYRTQIKLHEDELKAMAPDDPARYDKLVEMNELKRDQRQYNRDRVKQQAELEDYKDKYAKFVTEVEELRQTLDNPELFAEHVRVLSPQLDLYPGIGQDEAIREWAAVSTERFFELAGHKSNSNEVLWEVAAPWFVKFMDEGAGWTSAATLEDVADGGTNLPDMVNAPVLRMVDESRGWDKLVRYGFDRVIGPAINSIVRQPMYTYGLIRAFRETLRWRRALLDQDLLRAGEGIVDRMVQARGSKAVWELGEMDVEQLQFIENITSRPGVKADLQIKGALVDAGYLDESTRMPVLSDEFLERGDEIYATIQARIDSMAARGENIDEYQRLLDHMDDMRYDMSKLDIDLLVEEVRRVTPDDFTGDFTGWRAMLPKNAPYVLRSLNVGEWNNLMSLSRNMQNVDDLAFRLSSTRSIRDAVPYIDSSNLRSHFQEYANNLVPFWYAEEQFMKRWARTLKHSPEAFRRAQLLYQGFEHMGVVRQDPITGEDVFVYPGSAAVTEAIGNVSELVFGRAAKLPVAMPLTGKVRYSTPGLDRLGVPSAGPLVAIPLGALATRFPELGGLEEFLTGQRGSARPIWEHLMPAAFRRFWEAYISDVDSNARMTSAANQAIAFLEAAGLTPGDDATAAEQEEFLDRVRNWARTVAYTEAIYAFAGPSAPSAGNLISGSDPTALINVLGIAIDDKNLRPQFMEMLQYMSYEDALAKFLEEHPDATSWTVFQSEKESGAPLPITAAALDFTSGNEGFINKYRYAGPWFIPNPQEAGSTSFSLKAYQEQVANEWRTKVGIDEFYRAVKFRAAAPMYFEQRDRRDVELEALQGVEGDAATAARKVINETWRNFSDAYMKQHPLFNEELTSTDGRNRRARVLAELGDALVDDDLPVTATTERIRVMYNSWLTYKRQRDSLTGESSRLATALRDQLEEDFLAWGNSYVMRNTEVRELWASVIAVEARLDRDKVISA